LGSPIPSPAPALSSHTHVGPHVNIPLPDLQDTSDPENSQDDEEGGDNDEEMEIDETSDGEDDRRAHEILQATDQTATTRGNSLVRLPYDNHSFAVRFSVHEQVTFTGSHIAQELGSDEFVLQQHHKRNRTLKAPMPLPPRLSSVPLPQSLPATPPLTPAQLPADDRSTLDSYPPLWREVITSAKKTFRAYIAGKNGFPNPSKAVEEARECLEDALEVHCEGGKSVEACKWNYHRFNKFIAHRSRISMQHLPRHGNACE